MKRMMIGILAGSLILGSVAAASAAGPFANRESRPKDRTR